MSAHRPSAPLDDGTEGRPSAEAPGPPSDEPSDESLFAAHVAGESGAFELLFGRHAQRIYGAMRRRGLSHDDSQDLVQQTFLAAHRARRDFRPGCALLPWLWTIAFNLRRRAYHDEGRAVCHGEGAASATSSQPRAYDEARRDVRQAIARLTPDQQEVIVLHWYEGWSFHEIGRALCASEGAIKVRAHRAYEKLRKLLHERVDQKEPCD